MSDTPVRTDSTPPSSESQAYTADVVQLRAYGCRCQLRWNGKEAIPAPVCDIDGESIRCPYRPEEDRG